MPRSPTPIRVLVLFHGEWEDRTLAELEQCSAIAVHREGFDPRRFPECLKFAWFDARRFVDRLCERYRGRIDAVWSNDEQFGCLLAAIVAERLGLPGTAPVAIATAQHKLAMRHAMARALPQATVPAIALPFRLGDRRLGDASAVARAVAQRGLSWPLFCKPVKGTFSVLARRVGSAEELAQHLRLSWFDRVVLGRLIRPFESLAERLLELPCPTGCLLLEQPMSGHQVNVDGYAHRGELRALGLVDEWMYPGEVAGARHFAGFTYPSRLPRETQDRIVGTAFAAMRAIGFSQGMWNVELFVGGDGSIRVIEINPRAAGQFATLYRDVEGLDALLLAIWLAAGRDPGDLPRHTPRARVAGSFVFRRFDGHPGVVPRAGSEAWLSEAHPHARLWLEPTGKQAVRREYRWLGSHRYAILNCAAPDFAQLQAIGDECGGRLFGVTQGPLVGVPESGDGAASPRDQRAAVRKPANTSVR